jgi:hypothetical protein
MWRSLTSVLKWVIPLGVLCGAAFGLKLLHDEANEADEDEQVVDAPATTEARAGVIELNDEQAKRLGVEVVKARGVDWVRRVTVYGRVVPNAREPRRFERRSRES